MKNRWVINLLEGIFEGTIKNAAQQGIQQAIVNMIDVNLRQTIANTPFMQEVKVGDVSAIIQIFMHW